MAQESQQQEERWYGVYVMHREGKRWKIDHEGVLSFETLADEVFCWFPEARDGGHAYQEIQKWLANGGKTDLHLEDAQTARRIEFNLLRKPAEAA